MNRKILTIIILTLFVGTVWSQEIISFPGSLVKTKEQTDIRKSKSSNYVKLPFYDDFSRITGVPNADLWEDDDAYINTDYAKFPPTIGVATLDAVDASGALHPGAGTFPFRADELTSNPIRLDSMFLGTYKPITIADSVYLSFYYQPQGNGLMPALKDSLILEFHSPGTYDTIFEQNDTIISKAWDYVWSSAGGVTADNFAISEYRYFRQVMIPIVDSAKYFKKGFQFRFRNIASLADNFLPDWRSNCDHWNIDVVWLNVGRNINDTLVKDVAFADKAPSMLKNYNAMPYAQYNANFLNEMKDTLTIRIANLDNQPRNLTYHYLMRKDSRPYDSVYGGGSYYISPYNSSGYSQYRPFARPPVARFFPLGTNQTTVFKVYHVISNDPNPLFNHNDTIIFDQVFSNYYAYDDGTAEAGFGLNNVAGAYAVRFNLNVKDTLHGIQMYFNQVVGQTNQKNIDLIVLNDVNGRPGNIIKTMPHVKPIYSSNINQFVTYWFDEPIIISAEKFPGLIFYIGWRQYSNDNLNVGFDRYNDSHQHRYYNISGIWEEANPSLYGSLMMRPVVGYRNPLSKPVNTNKITNLTVSPNPSDGNVQIQIPESWKTSQTSDIFCQLFSSEGKNLWQGYYQNKFDFSFLKSGIYYINVTNLKNNQKAFSKIVIVR